MVSSPEKVAALRVLRQHVKAVLGVVRGLRLWQQGMREFETVSGFGSRACMKLRKSQALAAGHA